VYGYQDAIAHLTARSDPIRTLHFFFAHAHKRFLIKDSDGQAVYYIDFSRLTHQPDVEVHAGNGPESPIVAMARFRWSRHLQLGLVGTSDPNSMIWEKMRNTSVFSHSQYRFEVADNGGRRRGFLWKRIHNERYSVEGILSKMSVENFKLVDEATGTVLAFYLDDSVRSWRKKGRLQILAGTWADKNQTIVALGICGLLEKVKRRIQGNANISPLTTFLPLITCSIERPFPCLKATINAFLPLVPFLAAAGSYHTSTHYLHSTRPQRA